MKEKILDTFKTLGFDLELLEDMGYGFEYEGKRFIYLYDDDDQEFLNIALPVMLEMQDENDIVYYKMMDKLNVSLKYVKANLCFGGLWMFYERELFGGEDLKEVISHMILRLEAGFTFLCRMKAEEDHDDDTNDAEDADTDCREDAA